MFKKALLSIVALASFSGTAHATDSKVLATWTEGLVKVGHVAHDTYSMNVAFILVPDAVGDATPVQSGYKDNKCSFILRLNNDNRFLQALMDGFLSKDDRDMVAYAASLHELGHCLTEKQELAHKDDKNNELAQDIFALAYIAQNDPTKLDKAVKVFDHIRNDFQEEGAHAFHYDYKDAVKKIQAIPATYTPMQIARQLVYNTTLASK